MSTSSSSGSGSGSSGSGSGSSGSKIPINRRDFMKGAAGAAVVGTGGLGLLAANEHFRGDRYLPGIDKESFEREVDELEARLGDSQRGVENASESFEEDGFSLNAEDYRGRGLEVTDSVRVAVPEDSQSQTIQAEQSGDSREFQWLDGTSSMDRSLEDLAEDLDADIGLSEDDLSRVTNDELLEVANNMVPYVRSNLNSDGSDGQPNLGDEVLEDYGQFMNDIIEAESAYQSAVKDLSDVVRELGQQRNTMTSTDTAKIEGTLPSWLPLVGSSDYDPDEHFDGDEANDMIGRIESLQENAQEAYGQALSEYALVSSLRRSGEQIGRELDIAQDIYAEGEFDETGEPADGPSEPGNGGSDPGGDYDLTYDDLGSCEQERADQFFGDEAQDYQFRVDGEGDIDYRTPDGTEGSFDQCEL